MTCIAEATEHSRVKKAGELYLELRAVASWAFCYTAELPRWSFYGSCTKSVIEINIQDK